MEWEQIESLLIELYTHSANAVSDKICILGGKTVNEPIVNNLFEFDPVTNKYPLKRSMKVAKCNLSKIQLDNDNTLNWESVKGTTSYNVYRRVKDGICELIVVNFSVTTYIDKNQEPGNTYYYVVWSVNENGISGHSNEVSVEVPNPPVYKRALLVIRMVSHDWFEYDLTENEIKDFMHWYDNITAEDLKAYYVFNKDFNMDSLQSYKDHIVYNKIVFFEIKEH